MLKLQGLDDASILDQLTMVFTKRVVDIIFGILGGPTPSPTAQPGLSKLLGPCEEDADCAPCKSSMSVFLS